MKALEKKSLVEALAILPEVNEIVIETVSEYGDYSSTETFVNSKYAGDRIKEMCKTYKMLMTGVYDGTMTIFFGYRR